MKREDEIIVRNNEINQASQSENHNSQNENGDNLNALADNSNDISSQDKKDIDNNQNANIVNESETILDNDKKTNKVDDDFNIELSEEIINEKVKGALEYKNSKNKKKSIIFSICMLILNLFFMYFIVKKLFSEIDGDIFGVFKNQGNKLWWLVGGVFSYILSIVMQVIIYRTLLSNLSKNKSIKIAYDTAIVGKYYDNVTPFAIGGQPMQIVSLINNNVSPAVSTGIPLIKMVINTGMSAVSALVFFVFGLPVLQMNSPLNKILLLVIEVLGIIGLAITLLITLFMFLLSSGTLITRSFISKILRFGYKIKLVKNYRKTYRKILNQVAEYKYSVKYLLKNKKVLFKLILISFIENVAYSLIPFFVVISFSPSVSDNILFFMFMSITKYFLCTMASCFIPIPGGTGMMEISFIILFGVIVGNNIVWALLFWRFLSYYLIIIHGFLHELIKIFTNLIKSKKLKNSQIDIENNN